MCQISRNNQPIISHQGFARRYNTFLAIFRKGEFARSCVSDRRIELAATLMGVSSRIPKPIEEHGNLELFKQKGAVVEHIS